MTETNTLGLVGDGDDLDILVDVELFFKLKIEDQEAEALENVGDLFDLVVKKLGPSTSPNACFSAHAFYALKNVFRKRYPGKRIAPDTPLRDLSSKRHNEELWAAIESGTKFELPKLTFGWGFWISVFAVLVSVVLLFFVDDKRIGAWLLVVGLFGVLAFQFDHGRIPFSRDAALRDLAYEAVIHNFGSLTTKLGGYREKDAWESFTAILAYHSGVGRNTINRETVFFS